MAVLPRVGDLFGRYRIDSQLGRGGMGVVFTATDTTIDRRVALKVVSPHLGASTEFRQRFEREAAVLAKLDSPHVIAIYDYGTHDDCPYIATQFVAGGDLGKLLHDRGPMPAPLALKVCAQVADALNDAHRVGVVHRDVKPTNVLLRDADTLDVHAYLCDFGIARTATDGLTAPGSVAGTWSYLSPECGRGAPGSPASDVYALGCMLWATLTGRPPYQGSDVEIAVAHQRAPVPQLPGDDDLARHINHVLRLCLAKDPDDRYATVDQARVDLQAAGTAQGPVSRPLPPLTPLPGGAPVAASGSDIRLGSLPPRGPLTSPPARRRRARLVVALTTAAVVAVAGGVVLLTQVGGDDPAGPEGGPTDGVTSETTDSTESPTDAAPEPTPTETTEPEPGPANRLDEGGPITGDRDGDGYGDLVVDYSHGQIYDRTVWRSDGTAFVDEERGDQPSGTRVVGDFDGDDVPDIVMVRGVGERDDAQMAVRGVLSGGDEISETYEIDKFVGFAAATDLNGDGRDDLVVRFLEGDIDQTPLTFAAALRTDDGFGPVRELFDFPYSYFTTSAGVGDVDGDGRGDIVLLGRGAETGGIGRNRHELTVYLGQDDGSVVRGPSTDLVDSSSAVVLPADIDGDERKEILVLDPGNRIRSFVVAPDASRFKRPRNVGTSGGSSSSYSDVYDVSDVNGDGLDDLIVVVRTTGGSANLNVGLSNGTRLRYQSFGTWKRRFTRDGTGALTSTDGKTLS